MWLTLAFTSAALLGFYDAAKKQSLTGNAVLPVLLLNTLFSALFLLPMIVSAECGFGWFDGTILAASSGTLRAHGLVLLKAVIVLTSWIFGYFAMKHLPITGVVLTLLSLFLLSRSSRREGVDFRHNVWILCIAVAALAAVVSGLYDKYIMARLDPVFVQGWCNLYLFGLMSVVVGILWCPRRRTTTPFHWTWAIPLISFFLVLADFAYFYALHQPDAMVSVVSMVRRSSVVVSFLCGAVLFREHNLRSKAFDLAFILVGMFFLWLGSR